MVEFYISSNLDLHECRQSKEMGRRITIVGLTKDGERQTFTGIVESLQYVRGNPGTLSWRVTMRDERGADMSDPIR
jgi:hypothetical protein